MDLRLISLLSIALSLNLSKIFVLASTALRIFIPPPEIFFEEH